MLGQTLKELREARKLTQDDLAKKLGVSRQAVCMWEADKRELRASMINKIADALSVSVAELVKPREINVSVLKKEEIMAGKGKMFKGTSLSSSSCCSSGIEKCVDFELMAPEAKKVSLTGSFNSWAKTGIEMAKSKAGLWKTTVNLKPGKYEYKFIVDGQWWNDPKNNYKVTNAFGSQNSVKEVTL
ncbi:MAG: helix-turn-helix domain-containing protein [Candidatus Omnitrophica bacterium]|nr:helix-turn-helix domain-containing protein [Candidatus Omnitrophota bacterium]